MRLEGYDPRNQAWPEGANGWVKLSAELFIRMAETFLPDDAVLTMKEPDFTGECQVRIDAPEAAETTS
jgi:hypothetical protein